MMPHTAAKADTPQDTDSLLQFCKAAADGLRLQILRVLSQNAYTVQELCRILDCSQSGMSHHLKILAKAGQVAKRREGNSLFYRRTFSSEDNRGMVGIHRALMKQVDALQLDDATQSRLNQVVTERAASSQAFFAQHAGEFRQQQEQMVAYEVYGQSAAELLDTVQQQRRQLAIEIGPGEGAFLAELARRFERVIALDNAESMLARAIAFIQQHQLSNVTPLLGDSRCAELPVAMADCVVANMVLHHVPSPADIFTDAQRLLRTGGVLCVTDLCHHDQSWARDACGDLWLGFEPDDLSHWARAAGFEEGPAAYLAQLNGFQVQVRQFIKPGPDRNY